ncbi:hypothetical protein [Phyllobacterium sp. OV277]|uniref:hypothetical protein n=1 Tax=Phyllobacterium sp. OV277 TaxID=1882772 RepID=UPI00087F26CF|nr:hypothetical protein [Phyllobacterium sp. OV277]SDN88785.1 hypothetical protein SAMN05443582_101403 [Phyllobacterium sp. OV277]
MWNFSIARSLGLMVQTAPFIMLRIAVYFGMAVAYVLITGTGAGIGWGIGGLGDESFRAGSAFIGGLAGFCLTAGVLYLMREYILYVVKAAHIAVLVELLDGRPLPDNKGQIDYGKEVVTSRFAETSTLFVIDQLIKGVLTTITGLVQGIASFLPIPGLQQLASLIRAFLRIAVGFIDEVMLGYTIRTRSSNPWQAAQTALVLYGQNTGTMLRNAAFLTIIVYALTIAVFILMLTPAAALVYWIPGGWSSGGLVAALIFAWAIKAALIEPFAIACMMQVFFRTIEGQLPNPEWDAKLSQISSKFRTLKENAGTAT